MKNKTIITVIIVAFIIFIIWLTNFFSYYFSGIKITAVFNELELYSIKNLDVYYKGFKLGKTGKIYLSSDGRETLIEMYLKMNKVNLPDNITAKIKNKNKKDIIEIEYPKMPSKSFLESGDNIEGLRGFDITSYINTQADSGGLDEIKNNLNDTIVAAGDTMKALSGLITTIDDILIDIKPSIKESSLNFAKTTKNLEDVSKQLSKTTRSKKIQNTGFYIEASAKNIEQTTKNLELSSKSIVDITQQIKDNSITEITSAAKNTNEASANLNCIMLQVRTILSDVDSIIKGIKTTLSKKMSGIRMLFGKTIS